MQSVRLDNLMIKGIRQTKPYRNGWIYTTPKHILACPLGAAEYAINKKTYITGSEGLTTSLRELVLNTTLPFTEWPDPVKSQLDGAKASLMSVITTANDSAEMTREAIAEWVGWLIDEKDYDLTVKIEEEATESPQYKMIA